MLLGRKPGLLADPAQLVAQGVGVTGQRLGLATLRVAVAAVVAFADLCGRPAQLEQDGGLLEQGACGRAERRFGQEGQGGQGAEQQGIGQTSPLTMDLQAVQDGQDAELVVKGAEFVEEAAGRCGGQVGALPLTQRLQDRLAVPPIPDAFDGNVPLSYIPILPPASLISNCLAGVSVPCNHVSSAVKCTWFICRAIPSEHVMNKQPGRLLLTGVCCLAVVSAAPAQPWGRSGDNSDNASHPSHRLLDTDIGDLAGAEDQLARRLHHTYDMQEIQDLVKPLLEDKQFKDALQEKFKDLTPAEIENLKKTIQKNPELLDDPKLHEMLKDVEKLKKNGDLKDLPQETRESMAKLFKDAYDKQQSDPGSGNPISGGPMNPTPQPIAPPPNAPPPPSLTRPSLPKAASPSSGWRHDLLQGMSGLVKDIGGTPEGERLRTEALRDLAKLDSHSPGSSSGLTGFLKGVLSPDQASWLSRNGKSSHWDFGSWNSSGAASALPSFGGSSGGALDGAVWVAALALLVAAGWMAVAVARRQAVRREPGRGRRGRGRSTLPRCPRART